MNMCRWCTSVGSHHTGGARSVLICPPMKGDNSVSCRQLPSAAVSHRIVTAITHMLIGIFPTYICFARTVRCVGRFERRVPAGHGMSVSFFLATNLLALELFFPRANFGDGRGSTVKRPVPFIFTRAGNKFGFQKEKKKEKTVKCPRVSATFLLGQQVP